MRKMQVVVTLAILACLVPLSQAADTVTNIALLKIFSAVAVTKERLRAVPMEFAPLALLATYAGESDAGITLPNSRSEELLPALDQKDAYWGKQLETVLRAQQACREGAGASSGLIIVDSLMGRARECASLMTARQIVELILVDIAKDRICARLLIAKAWTAQDAEAMFARKTAAFDKIDGIATASTRIP